MDKIWDRNPSKSEVIGRCGEDEKTEWPRRTDKSQTLKKAQTVEDLFSFFLESKYLKLIFVDIVYFCKPVKLTHTYFQFCCTCFILCYSFVHLYLALLLDTVYKNWAFKKKTFEK